MAVTLLTGVIATIKRALNVLWRAWLPLSAEASKSAHRHRPRVWDLGRRAPGARWCPEIGCLLGGALS
jgi:hypothetical protein